MGATGSKLHRRRSPKRLTAEGAATDKTPVTIHVGTQSGTAERVAQQLARAAKDKWECVVRYLEFFR